jgi:antitoxin MazE
VPIVVKKWGNSAAIRIPAPVLEAARIHLEQVVVVRAEAGRIVIEPASVSYDLDSLVDAITSDNRHDEVGFGAPVGREML